MKKILDIPPIYYAITLLCAVWWIVPLWMIGTFHDGVFYANIARNFVYEPSVTIWDLKVSSALDAHFNGHPPMAFWIQSLFFAILGDYYWIERLHGLLCAFLTAFLIHKNWRCFNPKHSSLPIFFWTLIPLVGWAYSNNIIENTLAPLCAFSVFLLLQGFLQNKGFWWRALLAGALLWVIFLVKGPVGLFPLATPILYSLVYDKKIFLKSVLQTVLMLLVFLMGLGLLFYFDARAWEFFNVYWTLQLSNSLYGLNSIAENRFELLVVLFSELLIVNGLLIIMAFLARKSLKEKIPYQNFLFWLLLAFSASLPMLISPKQAGFYLIPSLVYYSLALASLALPFYKTLSEKWVNFVLVKKGVNLVLLSGILFCIGLSISNIGHFARKQEVLEDVFAMGKIIPKHSEICICVELYEDWNLHGFMYRYFFIGLSTVPKDQDFALIYKGGYHCFPDASYRLVPLPLHHYELYKRIKN